MRYYNRPSISYSRTALLIVLIGICIRSSALLLFVLPLLLLGLPRLLLRLLLFLLNVVLLHLLHLCILWLPRFLSLD